VTFSRFSRYKALLCNAFLDASSVVFLQLEAEPLTTHSQIELGNETTTSHSYFLIPVKLTPQQNDLVAILEEDL
jgi:hypothetical protein